MVLVELGAALICFMGGCYPALIGADTPTGEYQMEWRATDARGYGGDVLQFKETERYVYAIHRVWTLDASQRRIERIQSDKAEDRQITSGCINVTPEVYDKLVACCFDSKLEIRK